MAIAAWHCRFFNKAGFCVKIFLKVGEKSRRFAAQLSQFSPKNLPSLVALLGPVRALRCHSSVTMSPRRSLNDVKYRREGSPPSPKVEKSLEQEFGEKGADPDDDIPLT